MKTLKEMNEAGELERGTFLYDGEDEWRVWSTENERVTLLRIDGCEALSIPFAFKGYHEHAIYALSEPDAASIRYTLAHTARMCHIG